MPESLKQAMIDAADRFFNLTEEKKQDIAKKYVAEDPTQIRYGTSYNAASERFRLWRDFVKLRVHPRSHASHDLHDDQHDFYRLN